jgi:peptidoglycan hydrolase CwlO-like protein
MTVEKKSIGPKPRLEIDEKLGLILAVVSGVLLSIAAGGWMILLSNVTQLKSTFDAGEAQRFAQMGQMEGRIRVIQDKIDSLTGTNGKIRMIEEKIDSVTGKFQQIETVIKQTGDEVSKSDARINRLEEQLDKPSGQAEETNSGKKLSK